MPKNLPPAKWDLTLFFVFAFVCSWLLWLPAVLVSTDTWTLPAGFISISSSLGVFGPAIAAFSLTGVRHGRAGVRQLWQRGWDRRFTKVWLIPTLALLPAVGVVTVLARIETGIVR